jgi:hypothetical protein
MTSEFPLDGGGFREVVRHPEAHAVLLAQYRVGEHAGVVALRVFAALNAIERLAYTQFEHHLLALDRPEDVVALEGVMAEEKFHLSYVEAELERQAAGPHGAIVTTALEQARARFADFRQHREHETRAAIERVLGTTPR